jgi:hypothetical protein
MTAMSTVVERLSEYRSDSGGLGIIRVVDNVQYPTSKLQWSKQVLAYFMVVPSAWFQAELSVIERLRDSRIDFILLYETSFIKIYQTE